MYWFTEIQFLTQFFMCFHQENKLLPSTLYFNLINLGVVFCLFVFVFALAFQSTRTHWHPLIKINPTVNLFEERNVLESLPWISPFWVSCGGINKRVGFNHFEGLDLYICPALLSTKRVIPAVAAGRLEGVVMGLGRSGRWNLKLCWIWPNDSWKVSRARGRCWARIGEAWSHLAQ